MQEKQAKSSALKLLLKARSPTVQLEISICQRKKKLILAQPHRKQNEYRSLVRMRALRIRTSSLKNLTRPITAKGVEEVSRSSRKIKRKVSKIILNVNVCTIRFKASII